MNVKNRFFTQSREGAKFLVQVSRLRFQVFFALFVLLCGHSFASRTTEYFGLGKYEDGDRAWYARMYDGSVEATFDDDGNNLSASRYGAFGKRISGVGVANNREAFQGQDFRKDVNHYNLGVRNMNPDSGGWLQPEPLIINGHPPLGSGYRYAHNLPTILGDPSGLDPIATACNILPGITPNSGWWEAGAAIVGVIPFITAPVADAASLDISCQNYIGDPGVVNGIGVIGDVASFVPELGDVIGKGAKYGTYAMAAVGGAFLSYADTVRRSDMLVLGRRHVWELAQRIGRDIHMPMPCETLRSALGGLQGGYYILADKVASYYGAIPGGGNVPLEVWERIFKEEAARSRGMHFAIDNIKIDWSTANIDFLAERNFTVSELLYIFNDPDLLAKTKFYLNGEEIGADAVKAATTK